MPGETSACTGAAFVAVGGVAGVGERESRIGVWADEATVEAGVWGIGGGGMGIVDVVDAGDASESLSGGGVVLDGAASGATGPLGGGVASTGGTGAVGAGVDAGAADGCMLSAFFRASLIRLMIRQRPEWWRDRRWKVTAMAEAVGRLHPGVR